MEHLPLLCLMLRYNHVHGEVPYAPGASFATVASVATWIFTLSPVWCRMSLTLCKFCYEGEWTCFRRRVFEVVRQAKFSFIKCLPSRRSGRASSLLEERSLVMPCAREFI